MRHHWRVLCWTTCLMGCGVANRAMAQTELETPQYPQYVQYPQSGPPVTAVPAGQVSLSPAQVDQLLGPIALYPDPLLSLIFPAATYPQDVAAAEQWLTATPNPTEDAIAAQPWDDSIKGLVHYPTVLKMMNDQMDWTQALGAEFLNQQQDVMDSVQRLRAEAQAANNLQSTPQLQVVPDEGAIRIEPVDPNVIYVPQYDPLIVYTNPCPITFGIGFPIGLWCDNDFDWRRRDVVIGGGWFTGWRHPAEWDRNPPQWDRRPNGWVANPRAWVRAPQKPAPRLTQRVVSRVGLDRPRGAGAVPNPPRNNTNNAGRNNINNTPRQSGSPLPVGRQAETPPSRNAFDSPNNRADVQREQNRVRPVTPTAPRQTPAPAPRAETIAPPRAAPQPAPAARFEVPNPPRPAAPAPAAPRVVAPAPRVIAPAAPRIQAPAAPNNAFNGGNAGAARAESARGKASGHR